MSNKCIFKLREPLNKEDTEYQKLGCRHSNYNICKNCDTENICAFVRNDGICKRPPMSWKKQFNILKLGKSNEI